MFGVFTVFFSEKYWKFTYLSFEIENVFAKFVNSSLNLIENNKTTNDLS